MNQRGGRILGALAFVVIVGAILLSLAQRGARQTAASPPPSTPAVAATPSTPPLAEALLDQRVTVLILGRDWDEDRREAGEQANTDSIMLAIVNADHDQISVVSLPRDTVDVPLENGETWSGKVNAISRELGIVPLRGALETLFGVEIDFYAQVDMDDFERLVDAVGGVDVETEEALSDQFLDFFLEPGAHHLDGADALSYARTRQDGDHARSARQQELVLALMEELADPDADVDVIELAEGLASLETDIPFDVLPTFVELARLSEDAETTRQVLAPPQFALYEGELGERGWVMIPNIDEMRRFVGELMGDE